MIFGYTFIERNITGRIENNEFTRFVSFKDCCAAAQAAMDNGKENGIVKIQIVPCEYDDHRFTPLVMNVLKTIVRPPFPGGADQVENRQTVG
jgi:hypothetical protein